jgi:hypothetical protein
MKARTTSMKFHGPLFTHVKWNAFWIDVTFKGDPERIHFNIHGDPVKIGGDFIQRLLVEFEIVDNKPVIKATHWESVINSKGRGVHDICTRSHLDKEMTAQVNKVMASAFKRGLIG